MTAPAPNLAAFVQRANIGDAGEAGVWTSLTGGVSSDIWHVQTSKGDYCVKRALAQLKVAGEWHAPTDRNAYEWAYLQVAHAIAPKQIPEPLVRDDELGLIAMAWLPPQQFPNWKGQMLAGHVDPQVAAQMGDLLGRIHAATSQDPTIPERFASDDNFHALRIDPYLLETARQHPDLADRLHRIAKITAETHSVLVHGDVSPKNILIGAGGPVLLDAECAWFGDPAFDLAFCLTHLVVKTHKVPSAAKLLEQAFDAFCRAYFAIVSWENPTALEARAAQLLPALVLARIDGKSPVEYLDEGQRLAIRSHAKPLVVKPEDNLTRTFHGLKKQPLL